MTGLTAVHYWADIKGHNTEHLVWLSILGGPLVLWVSDLPVVGTLRSNLCSNQQVRVIVQARVVRKADNAIHRINHYPADSVVCFVNTCPLGSDLSGG